MEVKETSSLDKNISNENHELNKKTTLAFFLMFEAAKNKDEIIYTPDPSSVLSFEEMFEDPINQKIATAKKQYIEVDFANRISLTLLVAQNNIVFTKNEEEIIKIYDSQDRYIKCPAKQNYQDSTIHIFVYVDEIDKTTPNNCVQNFKTLSMYLEQNDLTLLYQFINNTAELLKYKENNQDNVEFNKKLEAYFAEKKSTTCDVTQPKINSTKHNANIGDSYGK